MKLHYPMSIRNQSILLIALILIADQVSKIWVKTTMVLGQDIHVFGNWFILHFTENPGMAFGLELGGEFGKLILSLFRLVAIGLIIFYVHWLIKKQYPRGAVLGVCLVLAGALGNMIDSAFYGMIFSESYFAPAQLFPSEGGYAPFLHGSVVDMFYCPIIRTQWPQWFPFFGGQSFVFFSPVFNIADAAITTGVFYILLFQRKVLFEEKK